MSEVLRFSVHLVKRERGRVELRAGVAPPPMAASTAPAPARVARLVALAHHVEALVRAGTVRDYADVASLAGITRARVTQIVNCLLLAPDIQERLLFMDRPPVGREPLSETDLRPIACEPDWAKQRQMFARLIGSLDPSSSRQ